MSSTRGPVRKKGSRTPAASSAPAGVVPDLSLRAHAAPPEPANAGSSGESAASLAPDPVPAGVQQVLTLYSAHLDGVAFPDVSVAILGQAAADLRERVEVLEVARARLAQCEAAVQSALADLQRLAERGLAYARIYATENPELQERLAEIRLEADRPLLRRPRKPREPVAADAAHSEPPLPPAPNGTAGPEAGAGA